MDDNVAAPGEGGHLGPLPLAGIRVLAIENFIAGPVASMWLADAGAEVVKIERPDGGDQARGVPPIRGEGEDSVALSFLRANRNKQSVTLDLRSPAGKDTFLALVSKADVVLENLRPTAMSRLGLGYEQLREANPSIIYVSVSGFGHADLLPSPFSERPAFDITAQSMSGLLWRPERPSEQERPVYLGFPLADLYGATLAVAGTYQALYSRERSGEGARVDISLFDGAFALNELAIVLAQVQNASPAPGIHGLAAPFGVYQTADGWITVAVLGRSTWLRFVEALDLADLRESQILNDESQRPGRADLLDSIIGPWLRARATAEVIDVLERHQVPVSECLDVTDLLNHEQVLARKMLVNLDHPEWGQISVPASPIRTDRHVETRNDLPPRLGQHTEEVIRRWLGTSHGSSDPDDSGVRS